MMNGKLKTSKEDKVLLLSHEDPLQDLTGGQSYQDADLESSSEIVETQVQQPDGTQKKTYILQASGRHDLSSSGSEHENASDDSHCHTNVKRLGLDKKARRKLVIASVLCVLFMTGEMVGGFLAQSLAIISDAAHLLTDFASFMIALMALYLGNRPATQKMSFGWYRIEILGALVSILLLWVLTGVLAYSAVLRVESGDYEIDATIMLITAGTGVAFNIVLGTTLHQHTHSHGGHGHSHKSKEGAHHSRATAGKKRYGSIADVEHGDYSERQVPQDAPVKVEGHKSHGHGHAHQKSSNINVKAAFIHVIGDLFQSIGVFVAAMIIYYKPEWKIADPICTFMFSLFVLLTTLTIMRDILVVLMEGTPRGINFSEVRDTLLEVAGIQDIHNLRVWSLTMDKMVLSVHLAITKDADPHKVLKSALAAVQWNYNLAEVTMQIEEYVSGMGDCVDCQGPR